MTRDAKANEMIAVYAELERQCFSMPWTETMLSEAYDSGAYIFVSVCASAPDNDVPPAAPGEAARSETFSAAPGEAAGTETPVVGYACGVMAGDQAEVDRVCVLPEYRGRGYGARLMRELIGAFGMAGLSEIFLEVRSGNAPARALYEKLGFRQAGVRKQYYGTEDAVIYMLLLN